VLTFLDNRLVFSHFTLFFTVFKPTQRGRRASRSPPRMVQSTSLPTQPATPSEGARPAFTDEELGFDGSQSHILPTVSLSPFAKPAITSPDAGVTGAFAQPFRNLQQSPSNTPPRRGRSSPAASRVADDSKPPTLEAVAKLAHPSTTLLYPPVLYPRSSGGLSAPYVAVDAAAILPARPGLVHASDDSGTAASVSASQQGTPLALPMPPLVLRSQESPPSPTTDQTPLPHDRCLAELTVPSPLGTSSAHEGASQGNAAPTGRALDDSSTADTSPLTGPVVPLLLGDRKPQLVPGTSSIGFGDMGGKDGQGAMEVEGEDEGDPAAVRAPRRLFEPFSVPAKVCFHASDTSPSPFPPPPHCAPQPLFYFPQHPAQNGEHRFSLTCARLLSPLASVPPQAFALPPAAAALRYSGPAGMHAARDAAGSASSGGDSVDESVEQAATSAPNEAVARGIAGDEDVTGNGGGIDPMAAVGMPAFRFDASMITGRLDELTDERSEQGQIVANEGRGGVCR